MDNQALIELIDKYLDGRASELEEEMLFTFFNSYQQDRSWDQAILGPKAAMEKKLLARIHQAVRPKTRALVYLRRYAAAAAILFVIVMTYFLITKKENTQQVITSDVKAPVTNRATIRLANGQTIYLDSVAKGDLAMPGSVKLVKLADGKIVYSGNSNEIALNTLTNPKGSLPIDIALSDGTHVWLNAGSSVTYPVAFVEGQEREITMTGEAYFEVFHNAKQPFRVKAGNQVIEDIGTSFNVNAYPDESGIRTTLVEGSVKIYESVLTPGQQYLNGNISTANLEQVLAWKNGFFGFDNADIHTVMREIGRWYDMEVVFEGVKESAPFQGKIERGMTLSQLLKNLEMYHVHFRTDDPGKRIVVLP